MNKTILIIQYLTYLVAVYFIFMAFNALSESTQVIEKVLSFSISFLPALLIISIPVFFKQYYRISGLIYIGLSIIYLVYYRPYMNLGERWPLLVIVVIPLFLVGIIHILYEKKHLA